jgi:hypothetical protein
MRQRQRQGVDKGPEEGLQPSAARQHEPKLPGGFFFGSHPEAIEFWKDIATTYRDFGTVLFDLFNEPWDHGRANSRLDTEFSKDELNLWLHGGDKIIDKKPHHYVGYQTLLDTVREVGAMQG